MDDHKWQAVDDIFRPSIDEAGWSYGKQIYVLIGFIRDEWELDPLVAERFQAYLDEIVEREYGNAVHSRSMDTQESD